MFDGKKEATEREIQKYLEKDRPEYSKERTKIEYDEKNKLIIATIMGGKRHTLQDKRHSLHAYQGGNRRLRAGQHGMENAKNPIPHAALHVRLF